MEIYGMASYNWYLLELIHENKTTYTVKDPTWGTIKRFKKDKCAFPTEKVCLVWETWRGVNGRGGYRVERRLYRDKALPANQIERQFTLTPGKGWVIEDDEIKWEER